MDAWAKCAMVLLLLSTDKLHKSSQPPTVEREVNACLRHYASLSTDVDFLHLVPPLSSLGWVP